MTHPTAYQKARADRWTRKAGRKLIPHIHNRLGQLTMTNKTNINIPKKYAGMIELVEKDGDGYWAYAKEGYWFPVMGCQTAHEYTQKELLAMIRTVEADPRIEEVTTEEAETPQTVKVESIEIDRAEGHTEHCRIDTVKTWREAETLIDVHASSAPNNGAYDKTYFTVTYTDGFTYRGRIDLQQRMAAEFNNLANHMRRFLKNDGSDQACEILESYEIGK